MKKCAWCKKEIKDGEVHGKCTFGEIYCTECLEEHSPCDEYCDFVFQCDGIEVIE